MLARLFAPCVAALPKAGVGSPMAAVFPFAASFPTDDDFSVKDGKALAEAMNASPVEELALKSVPAWPVGTRPFRGLICVRHLSVPEFEGVL